jgi:DNA polymerase III alpha subunit
MNKDKFSQQIYTENDILGIIMQGVDITKTDIFIEEDTLSITHTPTLHKYTEPRITQAEYDSQNQQNWHMPDEYKELCIAKHILGLCNTQSELQRCGEELLLYQDRNLFNLLKYLNYLVDVMTENNIIWGVGRGSSVSSYVLYKLNVHKVDSMFYKLDVGEFLR